jgi:hypothetical protein
MEAFRWNEKEKTWHLFDGATGSYCYLHQIMTPVISGTEHRLTDMPYIYTLVQALLDDTGTWTLKASPFSNIYDALEYSEEILGYLPKFRDPNEDVYYATKEEK